MVMLDLALSGYENKEEDTHMADPSLYPDANSDIGDDTEVGVDRELTAGTPRWVKVFALIGIVLVLLFVILQFTGGGDHSPRRHTPPASVTEQSVQQP